MNKQRLIQKYLKNNLSPDERLMFDTLMEHDMDFKADVDLAKNIKKVIRADQRVALKKELQTIDAAIGQSKKKYPFLKLALAASVTILLLALAYLYTRPEVVSNEELFAQNFAPTTNVLHPLIRGEDSLTQMQEIFVLYENASYEKFIQSFDNIDITNPDYRFYLANAYLAIGNVNKAITILQTYLKNKNAKYKTKAHWYLALAYLKNDDSAKAKKELELIKNNPDFKSEKIKKILEIL